MKITKTTKLKDACFAMSGEFWQRLIDQVTDADINAQGYRSLKTYTIGEFIKLSTALSSGDTKAIIEFFTPNRKWWWQKYNITIWEVAIRLKWLINEMEFIGKVFESLEIKQDADERKAGEGIKWNSPQATMLLWAQKRFYRTSTEDAENVKLSDYLLAKKEEVDGIRYQRNLMNIHKKEHEQRRLKK